MTTKEWLTKQHIELIKDIPTENILAAAWDCGKTPCPRCEHREKTCNKHNIGATAIGLALIRLEELHAKEKED